MLDLERQSALGDPEAVRETLKALATLPRWRWPRDAPRVIASGLVHAAEEVRRDALVLAAGSVDAEVVARVMKLLEAPTPDGERLRAAGALEGIFTKAAVFDFDVPCDPNATDAAAFEAVRRRVRALFHDPGTPPGLRRALLSVAASGAEPWAAGAVRAAWRSGDEDWRMAAARCLDRFLGPGAAGTDDLRDLHDLILKAIAAPGDGDRGAPDDPAASWGLRVAGLRAAGVHGLMAAAPVAEALALDPTAPLDVRRAAIAALGLLGAPSAADILDAIVHGAEPRLAGDAAEAFEELVLARAAEGLTSEPESPDR